MLACNNDLVVLYDINYGDLAIAIYMDDLRFAYFKDVDVAQKYATLKNLTHKPKFLSQIPKSLQNMLRNDFMLMGAGVLLINDVDIEKNIIEQSVF